MALIRVYFGLLCCFLFNSLLHADSLAPVTSALLGGTETVSSNYISPVTVTLNCSDSQSGCQATYWSLNGADYQLYQEPVEVTEEGTHSVSFYSVDNSNNVELPKSVTFTIAYLTVLQAKEFPDGTFLGIKNVTIPAELHQDNLTLLLQLVPRAGIVAEGSSGCVGSAVKVCGTLKTVGFERRLGMMRVLSKSASLPALPLNVLCHAVGGKDLKDQAGNVIQKGDPQSEGPNNVGHYVRVIGKLSTSSNPNRLILDNTKKQVIVDMRNSYTTLAYPQHVMVEGVVRIIDDNGTPKAMISPVRSIQTLTSQNTYTSFRDIQFATGGNIPLKLDLYLPSSKGPYPTIVFIHGGSWLVGDKGDSIDAFMALAQQGYACASINYRFSYQALFPAQIYDCKAAVRWLKAHANQYKLDANRFGAWGPSAGGHLALMLATSGDVAELEDLSQGYAEFSSRVGPVVNFFGPTDFLQMDAHLDPSCTNPVYHDPPGSSTSLLVGCAIQTCPELVQRANPITYLTADDPPVLSAHGAKDCNVPVHQSQLIYWAAQNLGIPTHLNIVPNGGHGGTAFIQGQPHSETIKFFDSFLKDKSCILGFVKDANNNGIGGVTVTANPGGYTATTQNDGHYAFFGIPPGVYTITASKLGYSSQSVTGVSAQLNAAAYANLNLGNPTSSVSGVVNDNQEQPVENATVVFNPGNYTANTGADGFYSIATLPAGIYNATASKAGYQTHTITNINVVAGTATNVSFVLGPAVATISGTVKDTAGAGISGATVSTYSGGFTTTSDTSGNYILTITTPGTYNITAQKQGYISQTHSNVTVGAGASISRNFTLTRQTGTVSGTVRDSTLNFIQDALVTLNPGGYSATTNASGYYSISNVPTDTYNATASKAGYTSQNAQITIMANGNINQNFTLNPLTGSISGTVMDQANNPLAGVNVSTNPGGYSSTTNASGAYTISSVPVGTYSVTASKSGYASQTTSNVTVAFQATTTVNFTINNNPTNKVVNGDFESGFINTGWSSACSGRLSQIPSPSTQWGWNNESSYPFNTWVSTSIKRSGNYALGFSFCQTAPSPGKLSVVSFNANLGAPNASATFSVWAYHTDGNCPPIMCWNPGQDQVNPSTANSNGRYSWVCADNWAQINTWVNRTMTVTADASGFVTIMIGGAAHPGTASGAQLFMDDVTVVN